MSFIGAGWRFPWRLTRILLLRTASLKLNRWWTAFGRSDLHLWPKGGAIPHHSGLGYVYEGVSRRFLRHCSIPHRFQPFDLLVSRSSLVCREGQQRNPSQHRRESCSRQMPFGRQQPVVPRVLCQSSARLHQPLLQTGQRPVFNPGGHSQPAPQVPQVVGRQAQCQPHLVRAETMTGERGHLHRLLALFEPLLCRTALVIEARHAPARRLQIGRDESDAGEQLPGICASMLRNQEGRAAPRSQIFSEPIRRKLGAWVRRSASFTSSYPAKRLYTDWRGRSTIGNCAFFARVSVRHSAASSSKPNPSSNSRTRISPPSEVTREPWKSTLREALKES